MVGGGGEGGDSSVGGGWTSKGDMGGGVTRRWAGWVSESAHGICAPLYLFYCPACKN